MDLAVECDSVVVETTFGMVQARLIGTRGLSVEACQAFLRTLAYFTGRPGIYLHRGST